MKNGVVGKILLAGFVLNLLAACSQSSDSKDMKDTPTDPTDVSSMDTKSCLFDLNKGDVADLSHLKEQRITSTFFDKEFNEAYLDAVATTSVKATIDFIDHTDAIIYKSAAIKTSKCTSPLFADATTLPDDLLKRWNDATSSDSPSSGYTLGLYLPKNVSYAEPSLQNSAAIIVRENTNRWTVVHEFMHHLFMVRAEEQGYSEMAVRSQLSTSLSAIRDALSREDLSSEEVANLAHDPFLRYAEAMDSQLVHFTLEEMTIEATLKQRLASGTLAYVPSNSNWYIYSSGARALEVYEKIGDLGTSLLKFLHGEKAADVMIALSKIYDRKDTIRKLRMTYPYEETSFKSGMILTNYAPENSAPCSHSAEDERLLNSTHELGKITSALNKRSQVN